MERGGASDVFLYLFKVIKLIHIMTSVSLCFLQAKDLPTYKDNDFLTDGAKINIGPEAKEKLLAKLQKDVDVSGPKPEQMRHSKYFKD